MIGTRLIDRYEITHEVGKGGMGAVYQANDTYLGRDVAVKVINKNVGGSDGKDMLMHEACAAARLSHPNVVMVFDIGEHDGVPFIVMEMVPGKTLGSNKPSNFNQIVRLSRQVCAALQHAHEKNLVDRDVKPANVMVSPEGIAKLMNFGRARVRDIRLEPENSFAGTVSYVAPEQAMGEGLDGRTDLYALGVLMYELATGQLPFTGGSPMQVILKHIQEQPVPPLQHNPNIPSALNEIIVQLLEKDPNDRPANAAEVGYLLEVLNDLYRMTVFQ